MIVVLHFSLFVNLFSSRLLGTGARWSGVTGDSVGFKDYPYMTLYGCVLASVLFLILLSSVS